MSPDSYASFPLTGWSPYRAGGWGRSRPEPPAPRRLALWLLLGAGALALASNALWSLA